MTKVWSAPSYCYYCCCYVCLKFFLFYPVSASPAVFKSERSLDDANDVRLIAIQRASHYRNITCASELGWGLWGKDWGCCGDYDSCCVFASSLCYAHDTLCRCCRLGQLVCGRHCRPHDHCPDHAARPLHVHDVKPTTRVNDVTPAPRVGDVKPASLTEAVTPVSDVKQASLTNGVTPAPRGHDVTQKPRTGDVTEKSSSVRKDDEIQTSPQDGDISDSDSLAEKPARSADARLKNLLASITSSKGDDDNYESEETDVSDDVLTTFLADDTINSNGDEEDNAPEEWGRDAGVSEEITTAVTAKESSRHDDANGDDDIIWNPDVGSGFFDMTSDLYYSTHNRVGAEEGSGGEGDDLEGKWWWW